MVKIMFKTLQRETFDCDFALDSTVEDMKQHLHKERHYPLSMKLVFKGKVLSDNAATLAAVDLGPNKVVVIAAEPVKPAPAPAPAAEAPMAVETPATISPAATTPTASTATSAAPSGDAAAPPPDGEELEMLSNLMAMTGADMDKVKRALTLAQNNPDLAAELLFSGRPLPDPATLAQQQPGASAGAGADTAAGQGLGSEQMELVQILRQPQFLQMREEVVQNSQQLEPLLEQLGTAKPDILRLINNNQELFLDFLYGGAGDGRQVVQVTPEEKAAIERLEQMGFRRDLVLQAYFACEKDENLAADFLLSQPRDDWA